MSFSFDRLADYFQAVAALDAAGDPEKQRAIAAVLGLHVPAPEVREETTTAVPEPPAPPPVKPPSPPVSEPAQTTTPAEPARKSRNPVRLRHVVTRRTTRPERPGWLEHVKPLPPPRSEVVPPPAPVPLLAHRWSRAILSTSLSRETRTNTIDVDAIVDAVSRGVPLRHVPLRVVPSLSHGVQLLVDRGPASAPFHKDQELLIQQIQVVAGTDRVQVLRFDPSRGFLAGKGPRTRWRPYFSLVPPPPRTTVVLISDLGIATVPHEPNAQLAQWLDFLTRLHARGNRVAAFVPYAPGRWPRLPRGLALLVPWDRTTSVQRVRRIAGRRAVRRPILA